MFRLSDLEKVQTIQESTLSLLNSLVYQYGRAYVRSFDNQTYWGFGKDIVKTVKNIESRLRHRNYEFSPFLKKVRKTHNKVRDIYIATWSDKIVDKWLNNGLSILLNHWYSPASYAYRINNYGIDSCMLNISKAMRIADYFIKRDITKYFYTIDHNILLSKLSELFDPDDYLFDLLKRRILFDYVEDNDTKRATVGIPFGSSLACSLANIFLTDLDKQMLKYKIWYFRYADDFLIAGTDSNVVLEAADHLDESVYNLKLTYKPSHKQNKSFVKTDGFEFVKSINHLGIQFHSDRVVRLSIEKFRKILNFYRRIIKVNKSKIHKKNGDDKLRFIINILNDVINIRIRSAAIIDYYLKHVNDEQQLKTLDKLIAELAITTALSKNSFKKGYFRQIPFKKLRDFGLISLLHRNRLHRHGHLHINFLSLYNDKLATRMDDAIERRRMRINTIKLSTACKNKNKEIPNGTT